MAPAIAEAEPDSAAAGEAAQDAARGEHEDSARWPGWPGHNVFRMVVPAAKVGALIGRGGELIKKLCEDTRARVRILHGPDFHPDRIVLISAKEEPDMETSPAMDAVLRVCKRVNGVTEADGSPITPVPSFSSVRILVTHYQAICLIGKQGSSIKAIQESSGATIKIVTPEERPFYVTEDERVAEIQGETMKVMMAVMAVLGHLRRFLVDQGVLPLFEKNYNTTTPLVDPASELLASGNKLQHHQPLSAHVGPTEYAVGTAAKRDLPTEPIRSNLSLYGRDPDASLSGFRVAAPTTIPRSAPLITQITQTMQIPLPYAEDLIGIRGANISHIRATSGAVVTVQESHANPDEITVEIKGTGSQIQLAQELIQEVLAGGREQSGMASAAAAAAAAAFYRQETSTTHRPAYSHYYLSSRFPSSSFSLSDPYDPSPNLGSYYKY